MIKPTLLIDTREQKPFFLDKENSLQFPQLKIEWGTLKTGDYSIKDMSDPERCLYSVCVERKSLADLFNSTGNGRDRFERECQRMSKFDYAEIVIEHDLRACFKAPPPLSAMVPKSVYRTIIAWSQRYGIHCTWCPNRLFAEKHTYLVLLRFWEDRQRGGKLEFCKI